MGSQAVSLSGGCSSLTMKQPLSPRTAWVVASMLGAARHVADPEKLDVVPVSAEGDRAKAVVRFVFPCRVGGVTSESPP